MKEKILFIIPSLGGGGAQRALTTLSLELSSYYDVHICRFDEGTIVYPYAGTLFTLNIPAGKGILQKAYFFLLKVKRIRKLKIDLAIRTSISFLEGANYVNVLSRTNDKAIISVRGSHQHDSEITGWLGFIRIKILIPMLYRLADKIVVVTQDLRDEMVQSFGLNIRNLVVIGNLYDVNLISQSSSAEMEPEIVNVIDEYTLIACGRLHPQKGISEFLEVLREIRNTIPVRLVVFGDGVSREELVLKAERIGLKTYAKWRDTELRSDFDVYFFGFKLNSFVYFAKAKLFVFPSFYEGFPNALAEALACGIPVFSSDCKTGPREILAPGNKVINTKPYYAEFGVLLPMLNGPREQEVWTAAIIDSFSFEKQQILRDYAYRGVKRIQDFSPEKVVVNWLEII